MSLRCRVLAEKGLTDYCAHQYLCQNTRMWENTPQARQCPVAEDKKEG